jgi:hypothetical protein
MTTPTETQKELEMKTKVNNDKEVIMTTQNRTQKELVMDKQYTEYINNNTFGNEFWWDNDEVKKSVSNSKGRQFLFSDDFVEMKIWLEKNMGSDLLYRWLILQTEGESEKTFTYQQITEKISEFRIEMDKRLNWEEENIGEVQ